MAIAIILRGFNDRRRSVTPNFLSMGHFLTDFLRFVKNGRKSIEKNFEFFAKRSIEFRSFDLFV